MRKKAGWASIDSSQQDIAERRTTSLSTPVQQPLMPIRAPRMHRSSRLVTVTPGRADWIATMTLWKLSQERSIAPTLTGSFQGRCPRALELSGEGLRRHIFTGPPIVAMSKYAVRMEAASLRPDHLPTLLAVKNSKLSLLVKHHILVIDEVS